jgi:hypothetical protein
MTLGGEATNAAPWGLDGVRSDLAMMRTPDGHGRVELAKFHTPPTVRAEPEGAPANALGIRRILLAVDDVGARLRGHGRTRRRDRAVRGRLMALLRAWR